MNKLLRKGYVPCKTKYIGLFFLLLQSKTDLNEQSKTVDKEILHLLWKLGIYFYWT